MTRRSLHFAFVAVVAAIQTSSLFAVETVTRKSDGKKFGGAITDMSRNEFKIKRTVGEPEVIQANDISAVDWDSATGDLRLGASDENGGKFDLAIQKYTKSKADTKNPSEALKAEFDYVIARATARLALTDPAKQEEAIQRLQAAQKSSPEHFRYYESVGLLGQVQLAKGDYAAARTTFELLAKAPWSDFKLSARIASWRILMAENKLDEAIREFEAAAAGAGDSPADRARKYEAMLGQARALVMQAKHEDALKILDEVTDKGPAEESAL